MNVFVRSAALAVISGSLASCVTVDSRTDSKTGIKTTVVAEHGCNNPSVTAIYIKRPGHKEDSAVFAGPDACNTLIGAAGQVLAARSVRPSNTTLISGSFSQSTQGTNVNIGSH